MGDTNQYRESRLVNEFIAKNYKGRPFWTRVRLGELPEGAYARAFDTLRRWADAVVLLDDRLVLIEGKIRPRLDGIAQLELYSRLIFKTDRFASFKDKPLEAVYVAAMDDKEIRALVESKGFKYVIFKPAWVDDYLRELLEKGGI